MSIRLPSPIALQLPTASQEAESAAIDRFVGFGQGFAGHMLTFGSPWWNWPRWVMSNGLKAVAGIPQYVTVTRSGPQEGARKIKDHGFSKLRPLEAEYWARRGANTLGIGHVFKYPYAFYNLAHRADDPTLVQQFDAKAWQLF